MALPTGAADFDPLIAPLPPTSPGDRVTATVEARPLRAVVGEAVHRIRTGAGLRAEDVAAAARRYGLKWNQSRVSGLETGRKALGIEEIALLPQLLNEAIGRNAEIKTPVTLADLIPADAQIKLSRGVATTGATLRGILAAVADAGIPPLPGPDVIAVTSTDDTAARSLVLRGVLPAGDRPRGERARIVAHASREIWGRSLAEERDRIIAERIGEGEDPDRTRALRGRVTRRLVDELAEHVRASA